MDELSKSKQYSANLVKHKNKCTNIFDYIKQNNTLYICIERDIVDDINNELKVDSDKTDDVNNDIKGESEEKYVRCSILTDKIIEYDIEMFAIRDKFKLLNNYRPYFISFIATINNEKQENIDDLDYIWYEGKFISGNNENSQNNDNNVELEGILETSASPVNYTKGRLVIFKDKALNIKVLDKINSVYNESKFICTNNSDIESELNNAWKGDCPKTIDIYNVGHGNADYIRGKNHRILYDIGYNRRSFPNYDNCIYPKAAKAIRYFKPSCVILSHWDLDHIIGCAYAEKDIFNIKWIAPNLIKENKSTLKKSKQINAIRLANYLNNLNNLCLVKRLSYTEPIALIICSHDIEIKLWMGSGKDKKIKTNNCEGLIIEIFDKKDEAIKNQEMYSKMNQYTFSTLHSCVYPHVLLSGDVPYECMPELTGNLIDFLHVPHHCSEMKLDKLVNTYNNDCNKKVGKCAIISTNRDKSNNLNYNHNHYKELTKKFDYVISTLDNCAKNDEANLSIRIKYCNHFKYCDRIRYCNRFKNNNCIKYCKRIEHHNCIEHCNCIKHCSCINDCRCYKIR